MLWHSSLITHILLTKSVLPTTASSKSNQNNTMMPWDEVKIGSRKMIAHHACTKFWMNHCSSSAAMDSNNSLNLVDSTFWLESIWTDNWVTTSKWWIFPDDVDMFKDEVNKVRYHFHLIHYLTYIYSPKMDQLPPYLHPCLLPVPPSLMPLTLLLTCFLKQTLTVRTLHGSMSQKSMSLHNVLIHVSSPGAMQVLRLIKKCLHFLLLQVFFLMSVDTGMFLSFVIWYTAVNCTCPHLLNIVTISYHPFFRMKYPLAIVQRLFQTYGLDIYLPWVWYHVCIHQDPLTQCSWAKMVAFHLHGVIPSFHSHAHNWGCQLHWYPMYTEGVGLEDFEECE